MTDDKLRDALIRDEGLRLKAYQDSVGLWTIGIGHLLGTTQRMLEITKSEAFALFAADVAAAEAQALKFMPSLDALDAARRRVLVNMAFNLGGRLMPFTTFRQAVAASDWTAAAVAMMASKWAKQVGARAERLRDTILSGVD